MRLAWVVALALSAGCFSKYKKGIVTEGADAFSGAAEIKWNGWFELSNAPGFGGELLANSLVGTGMTVENVDVNIAAAGAGQPSATLSAAFAMTSSQGAAYVNESAVPWKIKGCKELEIKIGSGSVVKVPATWDGKIVIGTDLQETVKAEVPAEVLEGLAERGVLAVRACGLIAASTAKQVGSLKEWATKAALKPAPKPASAPAPTPAP